MSLAEIIRLKEDKLRFIKDHEVAAVYDADGNLVIEIHGSASSVDLGPYIDDIRDVGKATLVHNHPLGWQYPLSDPRHAGSSFSPEDIATACYAELIEIRAITPLYRFSMRPADAETWDANYWLDKIFPVLEKQKATAIRTTLESVKAYKTKKEVAEADFWHRVWLRMATDLPLSYERYKYE